MGDRDPFKPRGAGSNPVGGIRRPGWQAAFTVVELDPARSVTGAKATVPIGAIARPRKRR